MVRCRKTSLDALDSTVPMGTGAWLDRLVRIEAERPLRALDFYRRHAGIDGA
jgi:hypothetical protein